LTPPWVDRVAVEAGLIDVDRTVEIFGPFAGVHCR
jgi:hypothetical protein